MVHRPPDSRLLENLIAHEKEYARQLAAVFPLSHAALASLSAYAAASPTHPIHPVVDVLARSDDALQRYSRAIDAWREQLAALKELEDDLQAVLRDRDILVTRLIKASKSTREAHRSSRLITPLSGLGSASLSSLPSTITSTTASGPASTNTKLAQAQQELQACEAHLVAKERELDARRISLARDGLGARCRALIDCGWVWGEMGKQGLRALQALGAETSKPLPYPSPPRPGVNATYASDNSSLTPSQSASQTATRSAEMSHDGSASKEPPEAETKTSKTQTILVHTEQEDLTLTVPPAHLISELAVPTALAPSPPQKPPAKDKPLPAPAPRRRRARRPPSQHITEASDEASDGPSSSAHAHATPSIRTPFPTGPGTVETTSSEDDRPIGPFEVVDNDPIQAIRKSILSPSASALFVPPMPIMAPNAHASAPDVRQPDTSNSPSRSVPTPNKRQRRTSLAFLGSLRGLFRKPKERGAVTEWDLPQPTVKTTGWVTRTDARIRGGADVSDDEPTPTRTTPSVNVSRRASRLRKGRPGARAHVHGNGSMVSIPAQTVSMDGWHTDDHAGRGAGAVPTPVIGRTRTRKGTTKQRKTSVADLRGNAQGHTDGEVERGRPPVARTASSRRMAEAHADVERTTDRDEHGLSASTDPHTNGHASSPPRRAASGRKQSDATTRHRRSASLSMVDGQVALSSIEAAQQSTPMARSGSMSWRKPPPPVEPPTPPAPFLARTRVPSPSPSPSPPPTGRQQREASPKTQTRQPLGNGHAHAHAYKPSQSQSLMSVVADVTAKDGQRSFEVPRAPGSVLNPVERDQEGRVGVGVERRASGQGHARSASSPTGMREGQVQVQPQRPPLKGPLKSVLRNASRTPSPSPAVAAVVAAPTPVPAVALPTVKNLEHERDLASPVSLRDSASISSYETVRETLEADLPEVTHTPPPPLSFTFPPPPVEPPPVTPPDTTTSESTVPTSTSTSTEGTVRRKSVRVSLQPTFSPTPPALCDDDGEGFAPWSASFAARDHEEREEERRGRKTRRERRRADVWTDSSEEDEEYSRARRLLSLVGPAKQDKGKGRAR